MEYLPEFTDGLIASPSNGERRRRLRLEGALPAKVRGVDAAGKAFESAAFIRDISAEGLCLRLEHCVEPGARLLVIVQFSVAAAAWGVGVRIATHSLVLRSELERDGGEYVMAAAIMHHRFL